MQLIMFVGYSIIAKLWSVTRVRFKKKHYEKTLTGKLHITTQQKKVCIPKQLGLSYKPLWETGQSDLCKQAVYLWCPSHICSLASS